ncbi:MAG TPA: hypothetical protein VLH40_10320 [Atribacteraceae bacterium]|nr:hypothetical protein [Atribacteraceae bacterium]
MDERMNVIIATMKDFRDNREALKNELLRRLVDGCPHDTCFSLEEFNTQEDIKGYLAEMAECPADVFSMIFTRCPFFYTIQEIMGDKILILSTATLGWLAEIDAAISAYTSLPFDRESLSWSRIPDGDWPKGDEITD